MSKIGALAIELMELGALVPDHNGVPEISKAEYDAYMGNPDNFSNEESTDDMTPSETNEWLRDSGF